MSKDLFDHIANELKHQEVYPSTNASFEEVMRRRKKRKKGFIWWYTAASVALILGLLFVGNEYLNSRTSIDSGNSGKPISAASTQDEQTYESGDESFNPSTASTDTPPFKSSTNEVNANDQSGRTVPKPIKKSLSSSLLDIFTTLHSGNRNNGSIASSSPGNTSLDKDPSNLDGVFRFKEEPALYGKRNLNPIPPGEPLAMRPSEYLDWDFSMGPFEPHLTKKPWYVEMSAITGSNNRVQFDDKEPLSVLGTNYMAQYQASLFTSFQSSSTLWGVGIHYTQWVGNGEWREHTQEKILQPDSTYKTISSTTTGRVNYKIDKISIPVSYRGFTRVSKFNLRYGVQLAPGFTRVTDGTYFDATSYTNLTNTRLWSMDGKASVGPIVNVTKGVQVIIEPSVMYQSFVHHTGSLQGNWFGGLGVSMLYRIR